jgi:hypothetical protein
LLSAQTASKQIEKRLSSRPNIGRWPEMIKRSGPRRRTRGGTASVCCPLDGYLHAQQTEGLVVQFGIPVLFIAIFVALAVVSTQYPALAMNGNAANFWWIPAWFAGLIVAGALLYYVPRFIRARRGINLSFVYKELPPE